MQNFKPCDSFETMSKQPASVRLDSDTFERVKTLATVDRRSVSEIIAWAVERGLPALEAEQIAKQSILRDNPAHYQYKPTTAEERSYSKTKSKAA